MANDCMFSIAARGKKENVLEFLNVLTAYYNYDEPGEQPRHLFRTTVFNDGYDEENGDELMIQREGSCAWSVARCMTEDGYYSSAKKQFGERFNGTTLQIESERLGIDIEVFGVCLAGNWYYEHYAYNGGDLYIEESQEYEYMGDSIEEVCENLEIEEVDYETLTKEYNIYSCELFNDTFVRCDNPDYLPPDFFNFELV